MSLAPRERKLLLALAVLAGLAGLRFLWALVASGSPGMSEMPEAALETLAGQPAGAGRSAFGRSSRRAVAELPLEIVELDLGEPASQPYALTVGRDPFRFGAPPPPPRHRHRRSRSSKGSVSRRRRGGWPRSARQRRR